MVTRKEMSIRASEAAVWAFNLGWWFEVAETPLCFGTGFVLEWKIRNQKMEEGSERISTPIRSPSEKDSIILNRTSASSSPFGFRKVNQGKCAHSWLVKFNFDNVEIILFFPIFRQLLVLLLAFYEGNLLALYRQKVMLSLAASKIKKTKKTGTLI